VVKGAAVVFSVTNFWETTNADIEVAQGKAIADACKAANVKFLIWSSLLDVAKLTNGRIATVYHFDSKATIEQYIRDLGIESTFFMAGFYMTNLTPPEGSGGPISKSPNDGSYTLRLPFDAQKTYIPLFHAADTGIYIAALLLAPRASVLGKRWYAASQMLTPDEMARDIHVATGSKAHFEEIPSSVAVSNLPEPLREEMVGNFELMRDPGYYGTDGKEGVERMLDLIKKTDGLKAPTSFVDFIKEHLK